MIVVLRFSVFVFLLYRLSYVSLVGRPFCSYSEAVADMLPFQALELYPTRYIKYFSLHTIPAHLPYLESDFSPRYSLYIYFKIPRPQLIYCEATLVRLLTINAINAYLTAIILHLSGGAEDPRLLLPAWIWIASVSFPLMKGRIIAENQN